MSSTIYNGGYTISGNTSVNSGTGAGITYNIPVTGPIGSTYTSVSYNPTWNESTVSINTDGITLKEGADFKIGNQSILQTLKKIEDRLAILHPNHKLEEKWDQLKELRRQYEELEKDILEKEKLMKILKEK